MKWQKKNLKVKQEILLETDADPPAIIIASEDNASIDADDEIDDTHIETTTTTTIILPTTITVCYQILYIYFYF